jgi:hypothetical protein
MGLHATRRVLPPSALLQNSSSGVPPPQKQAVWSTGVSELAISVYMISDCVLCAVMEQPTNEPL